MHRFFCYLSKPSFFSCSASALLIGSSLLFCFSYKRTRPVWKRALCLCFSFFKYGKLFTVPADTREGLAFSLAAKLHSLWQFGRARLFFGQSFSASAFTVLAHEHRAAFAVYLQHHFAAFRTCRSRDVIVSERLVAVFDFFYRLVSVSLHVFNKDSRFQFSGGDRRQLLLPFCR